MSLPPIEFLFDASVRTLQDLRLASHNHSANLSKAVRAELEAWVEREATALLAEWLLTNREGILREAALRLGARPKKVELLESAEAKKQA